MTTGHVLRAPAAPGRRTDSGAGQPASAGLGGAEVRAAIGWLAYGAAWAVIAGFYFAARLHGSLHLQAIRRTILQDVLIAQGHGYGPLVAEVAPGHFLPAAPGDDTGLYYFVPLLHRIFSHASLDGLLAALFISAMCSLILVYPLLFRRLFDVPLVAVASAPLALFGFAFLANSDVYWVPAWAMALALPMLMVSTRQWTRWSLALLCLAMLIASFSSAMRAQSGLGLLAAGLGVAIVRNRSWRGRVATVLLLLAVYASVDYGVLGVARMERADRMHGIPVTANAFGLRTFDDPVPGHPFWHTAYIGLGYEPNKYGITYLDASAYDYAKKLDPGVILYSPKYETILRKRYLHILTTDPLFVAGLTAKKFAVEVRSGISHYPLLLVLVPAMLLVGPLRRRARTQLLVATPPIVLLLVPSLLAVPNRDYELGWYGLLATLMILGECWALETLVRAGHAVRASGTAGVGRRWQTSLRLVSRHQLSTPVVAIATSFLCFGLLSLVHPRPQGDFAVEAVNAAQPPPVTVWNLAHGLPRGWTPAVLGVRVRSAVSWLAVRTSRGRLDYQLESPTRFLPAGSYLAIARGQIVSGGMAVGVLDVRSNHWLAVGTFEEYQSRHGPVSFPVSFALRDRTPVRVILTDNSAVPQIARWRLRDVSIRMGSSGA